jgi:protein TonB
MTACSSTTPAGSAAVPRAALCTRRLAAFVAFSALVHTSFVATLTGESGSRSRPAAHTPALIARLVPATPDIEPFTRNLVPVTPETPRATRVFSEPLPRANPTPAAQPKSTALRNRAPDNADAGTHASNRGNALSEAPDPTYYAAKQLDVYPELSTPLRLGTVASAIIEARALLLVLIDASGVVEDVSVVEATPAASFENDAKRAVMSARFTPAYRNGRAVKSRMLIEVNYGTDERAAP